MAHFNRSPSTTIYPNQNIYPLSPSYKSPTSFSPLYDPSFNSPPYNPSFNSPYKSPTSFSPLYNPSFNSPPYNPSFNSPYNSPFNSPTNSTNYPISSPNEIHLLSPTPKTNRAISSNPSNRSSMMLQNSFENLNSLDEEAIESLKCGFDEFIKNSCNEFDKKQTVVIPKNRKTGIFFCTDVTENDIARIFNSNKSLFVGELSEYFIKSEPKNLVISGQMANNKTKKKSFKVVEGYLMSIISFTHGNFDFRKTSFFPVLLRFGVTLKSSFLERENIISFWASFHPELNRIDIEEERIDLLVKEMNTLNPQEEYTKKKIKQIVKEAFLSSDSMIKILLKIFAETPSVQAEQIAHLLLRKMMKPKHYKFLWQMHSQHKVSLLLLSKLLLCITDKALVTIKRISDDQSFPTKDIVSQYAAYVTNNILNNKKTGLKMQISENGVYIGNTVKILQLICNELSLVSNEDLTKSTVLLHVFWDGFSNYTAVCIDLYNKLIYLVGLFYAKEEKVVDDITKLVTSIHQSLVNGVEIYSKTTGNLVRVFPLMVACVDMKAELLQHTLKKVLLLLFCSGKKRYIAMIPINSQQEEKKYQDYVDKKVKKFDDNSCKEYFKFAHRVDDHPNERYDVEAEILQLNKKIFGTTFSAILRYCPFGCSPTSFTSPSANLWYYNIKNDKMVSNIKDLEQLVIVVAKSSPNLSKVLKEKMKTILNKDTFLSSLNKNADVITKKKLVEDIEKTKSEIWEIILKEKEKYIHHEVNNILKII